MNTRKINIMTSSDERLLPQLKVQMEAISRNLPTRDINFFLFYDGKARQIVESLYIFAENYANLRFFDVVIEQPDMYNILSASGGAEWGALHITASVRINICRRKSTGFYTWMREIR